MDLDNVSMKQIQEESGLASGSMYYHFKKKDEILKNLGIHLTWYSTTSLGQIPLSSGDN